MVLGSDEGRGDVFLSLLLIWLLRHVRESEYCMVELGLAMRRLETHKSLIYLSVVAGLNPAYLN